MFLYIKCSKNVLDVFWTFYVRSIYVMCPDGLSLKVEYLNVKKKNFSKSFNFVKFLQKDYKESGGGRGIVSTTLTLCLFNSCLICRWKYRTLKLILESGLK